MKALRWDCGGASPAVRLGLLHPEVDPEWYQWRCVIRAFRHQIQSNSVIRDWWRLFSSDLQQHGSKGPFGKLLGLLSSVGLTLDADCNLWFSPVGCVSLLGSSLALCERVVRVFFTREQTRLVQHRQGFHELEGFDFDLTMQQSTLRSAAEWEQLDIVRDGAFISDDMRSKYDARLSKNCRRCHVPATRSHKFEQCVCYSDIRQKFPQLFDRWAEYPDCFREHGLIPENPWLVLLWEAFCKLPDETGIFRFGPKGHVWHCFTDGSCDNPTSAEDSLAAWAVIIAEDGVVASGVLPGIHQTILRAETTAVLSAIRWAYRRVGTLHLWVDNQTVVTHLRTLLSHPGAAADFEHADLWCQIEALLRDSAATVLVHKVASHLTEFDSASPCEDFAIYWNRVADQQAGLANMVRPLWFQQVWRRFQDHRNLWGTRISLLHDFHLEVAARDHAASPGSDSEDGDGDFEPLYSFDRTENHAAFSALVSSARGALLFHASHNFAFRQVANDLLDWVIFQDESAAEARTVSLLELFVGFRLHRSQGPLLLCGSVSNQYQVTTFASDFIFFKKIVRFLCEQANFGLAPRSVNLVHFNVIPPQDGVKLGWIHDTEASVFSALTEFVGQRPITNSQGLAKPWHI